MKCALCDGDLISKKVPYSFKGIDFGIFDAYVCNKCNEPYMREKHLQAIEDFAKKMGVWGTGPMPPYIDTSTSEKSNIVLIGLSQLFNRPEKMSYITTSVK